MFKVIINEMQVICEAGYTGENHEAEWSAQPSTAEVQGFARDAKANVVAMIRDRIVWRIRNRNRILYFSTAILWTKEVLRARYTVSLQY